MTRTLINGKWVKDPIKDYSNGKAPVVVSDLLSRQNAHLVQMLKVIQGMTKAVDIQTYIRQAKASYPTK